jgi:SAM-dependent methyltransferase
VDEQEILAVLRAHVAQSQSSGSNGGNIQSHIRPDRVDLEKLDYFSADLCRLRNGVGQLNPRNPGPINRAIQTFKKLIQRSLGWYTRSLHEYHDRLNQALDFHARAIASLQQQVLQQGGGLPEILQETLRTERRATQEQQAPYAELFRGLSPVLDLGCGRGEFLELLKEKGISAYGIDSDHIACEDARRKLLKVIEGDLLDKLADVPDRSLGGIFCSRVIEYVPPHLQPELISRAAGKLKPGGIFIVETINPNSDFPFGRNSHIDPTHLRAIYPELLKSMVESNGFDECKIYTLAPQEVRLVASGDGSEELNEYQPTSRPSLSRAISYAVIASRR